MNRTSFALFVALLIHIVIFFMIFFLIDYIPQPKKDIPHQKKIKISLKEKPKKIVEKSPPSTKKLLKKDISLPKGSQLKKIVKHKTIKKKKEIKKEEKKIVKEKPKKIIESKKDIKKDISKPLIKKEVKNQDPMSWLYKSYDTKQKIENKKEENKNISQDIKKLYGDDFKNLSKAQQEYILDNQEIMRRITQQILNRIARVNIPNNFNVNANNIVEFYLHPNGDMTDFKFLSKSRYYILDDTTKETIEYAYSKYPRPKEKTLIRYNVFYNLAH